MHTRNNNHLLYPHVYLNKLNCHALHNHNGYKRSSWLRVRVSWWWSLLLISLQQPCHKNSVQWCAWTSIIFSCCVLVINTNFRMVIVTQGSSSSHTTTLLHSLKVLSPVRKQCFNYPEGRLKKYSPNKQKKLHSDTMSSLLASRQGWQKCECITSTSVHMCTYAWVHMHC
jgi:hypothetical protein